MFRINAGFYNKTGETIGSVVGQRTDLDKAIYLVQELQELVESASPNETRTIRITLNKLEDKEK